MDIKKKQQKKTVQRCWMTKNEHSSVKMQNEDSREEKKKVATKIRAKTKVNKYNRRILKTCYCVCSPSIYIYICAVCTAVVAINSHVLTDSLNSVFFLSFLIKRRKNCSRV